MGFRTHFRRCLRQASLDPRVQGVASWMRWIAVTAVLLGGAAEARAGGTPAGTLISARATVTFTGPNGTPGNSLSPDALVMMGQVAGVDVEPPRSSLAPAGNSVVFSHTLTNVGNGPDSFILTATSLDGWPIRTVLDVNGDGTEDAGDTPIVGPVAPDRRRDGSNPGRLRHPRGDSGRSFAARRNADRHVAARRWGHGRAYRQPRDHSPSPLPGAQQDRRCRNGRG